MSHIINGLQSIGVSDALAAQIAKEVNENITPSKNDGELATSIALNSALMGLFEQAEKGGVKKDALIMKLLDLLKGNMEGDDTIGVGDEFVIPHVDEEPDDDGFAPDALDDLDSPIDPPGNNTGSKERAFHLSGKQMLAIMVVAGLAIFYFMWGSILSEAFSSQLTPGPVVHGSGIKAPSAAPTQNKKEKKKYDLIVPDKEKKGSGYVVPPEYDPSQGAKDEKKKLVSGNDTVEAEERITTSSSRGENHTMNQTQKTKRKKEKTEEAKTYEVLTPTAKVRPTSHKPTTNSVQKENFQDVAPPKKFKPKMTIEKHHKESYTPEPKTFKDKIAEEDESGGVCNVGEEYVGGEYVYYILKHGKYVPVYRNPNWDRKGVVLTRRVVVNHHSENTGFVDIGKGRYLPVDFFSECTVF